MHCDTFVWLEWGGPAVVSGSGCIGTLVGVRTSVGLVLCNGALIELTILVPRQKNGGCSTTHVLARTTHVSESPNARIAASIHAT